MYKILLIEDAIEVQKLVGVALRNTCQVVSVGTLVDAEKTVRNAQFDLILLDIELPDGNGFKFCATLQNIESTALTPVVFLTGRGEVGDKVMGYSLGAEDYIVKPFDMLEFKARVEAKLKKMSHRKAHEESFQIGDLRFEVATQKVFIHSETKSKQIETTPLEFKLLYFFARNEERIFSREQLISAVWGDGVHILDRTIDTHVSNLRKKLELSNHTIRSVHGVGYRFIVKKPGSTSSRKPPMAA